jgi:hypothetical protein
MADPDDVEQQRALLQAYRRSLALALEQLRNIVRHWLMCS